MIPIRRQSEIVTLLVVVVIKYCLKRRESYPTTLKHGIERSYPGRKKINFHYLVDVIM